VLCRVIILIFSRSHERRSFTRRLVDETRLCVKEFTSDFSAKSQAASLAAVDAVRLNTDSAREASSRIARAAGKAHQKLERASYISALAKELHKTCVEEEEENRKEERQLKAALALIQSAGHSDRRSPQRSNRRYSPPSVAGRSDRRAPHQTAGRSDRRSPHQTAGRSDRRPPHQSSGRSDRRNPSHPTSGQTDRRATNQRDRSTTAGRISYYQSVPPDSQVHWTNKKVSSANNEPLGKRPVQSSAAAVAETASTSAQPTVEQQLPLQTLTLSEETPSLTTVPRPTGLLPPASELFIPTDRLQQRCLEVFGDQFQEEDIDLLSPKEKAALSTEPPLEEETFNGASSSALVVDNKLSSDVSMSGENDE